MKAMFLLTAAALALAAPGEIAVSSALAGGNPKPIKVTSTLDRSTVLPTRIHWVARPSIAPASVASVEFLIDGRLGWVERHAPYVYGNDGNHRPFGGYADVVLERAGRMADGWFPQMKPDDRARAAIEKFRNAAREAGRDPSSLGLEARLNLHDYDDTESRRRFLEGWRDLGATHLSINTMSMGLPSPQAHIEMIERAWSELNLAEY